MIELPDADPAALAAGSGPRNVFIVVNNIEETGGVQLVAHVLARGLAARGHNVELIGISRADNPYPYEVAGYRTLTLYNTATVDRPWRPRRLRHLIMVHTAFREWRRRRAFAETAARLSERFRSVPDGVVICMQVWAMQWVAAADTAHLRVVVQSHESYDASRGATPASQGSTRYRRIKELYPDADAFLLLTHDDADRFERDGFNNVGVMHNPLTRSSDRGAALDQPTVINVGRYHPQKNQQALLEAWAIVTERHPEWQLKLFGDGELEDELRGRAAELGIEKTAHICGPTQRVVDELLDSSVFALSSDFEGLPLVLAEAMECGVPCVSFDCGPGIREIIRDGEDGIVVPNRDVEALAEAICKLIADPALRRSMGAAARRNIQRFSPDVVFGQWEQLFAFIDR